MRIFREVELASFEAWQGGASTLEWLEDIGKVDEVQGFIDELFPDGLSETELNDLLWFDVEAIEEWIGETYENCS